MYTIDDLRQIDDAPLNAYQRSLMFHYWRVGHCWESLRTTAKKTGMSLGKVKQERDWLLENSYIQWEPAPNSKMSIVLNCSRGEQVQQPSRSRGEQCSCGEQECSCGERHLKKPNEEIKRTREDKTLIALFEGMTAFTPPHDTTDLYAEDWLAPAQAILSQSKDFDEAETRVTYAIQHLRKIHYTIKDMGSILTTALNWYPGAVPGKKSGNGRYPQHTDTTPPTARAPSQEEIDSIQALISKSSV